MSLFTRALHNQTAHVLPVFFILGGEFQQDNSFHLPRSLFSPCYPALPEAILFSDSFSPNLPSSSRQQIEAVPVPLRFGSSYLLALKSSSLSRAGRRQIGGDSERKASVSNPGGKGLRGFLHPKLGAFAYLLNRNRLLLCGKARSCPQIRV